MNVYGCTTGIERTPSFLVSEFRGTIQTIRQVKSVYVIVVIVYRSEETDIPGCVVRESGLLIDFFCIGRRYQIAGRESPVLASFRICFLSSGVIS